MPVPRSFSSLTWVIGRGESESELGWSWIVRLLGELGAAGLGSSPNSPFFGRFGQAVAHALHGTRSIDSRSRFSHEGVLSLRLSFPRVWRSGSSWMPGCRWEGAKKRCRLGFPPPAGGFSPLEIAPGRIRPFGEHRSKDRAEIYSTSHRLLDFNRYSKRYAHRKKGEPARGNEAGSRTKRPWDVRGPPGACTGRTRPGSIDQNRAKQSALQL